MNNNPPDCPSDSKQCKTLKDMEEINEPSEIPHRLKTFYCLSLCHRILGYILIALVVIWILQYRGGFFEHNFNWHPVNMILGMVLVYARGMLFYRNERTISMPRLKLMYARIMFGAIFLIVIGQIAAFEANEFTNQKTYIYTLHSWVGLTSVILFFFQCIIDFHSYFYHGKNQHSQGTYMGWYFYLVMGSFVGAVVACCLGFNEVADFVVKQGADDQSENTMIWFIYLTLITFGGLFLYLFSCECYKRSSRPEDKDLLTKTIILKHLFCIPWTFHECTYPVRMLFSKTHSPTTLTTVDTI